MSVWQIAFWFDSPNDWLNDIRPTESLDDLEGILDAAYQEGQDIVSLLGRRVKCLTVALYVLETAGTP
ncbi:hypothetical protein NBRC116583_34800 [Arenicella sp. 4NH20-0111]